MPAGAAFAPGTVPGGLAGFCRLPQGKVHSAFLAIGDVHTGAGLKLTQRLVAKLPVILKFGGPEVYIPIDLIGKALFHQCLYKLYDFPYVFRSFGMNSGVPHSQTVGVYKILFDILFRHLRGGNALLRGSIDYLVVHVSKVLDKGDLIAPVFKIAPEYVKHDDGAGVSHMDIIINCGAAGIHSHFSRLNWDKFLFLHGQSIKNLHLSFSLVMQLSSSSSCSRRAASSTAIGSVTWIWSTSET